MQALKAQYSENDMQNVHTETNRGVQKTIKQLETGTTTQKSCPSAKYNPRHPVSKTNIYLKKYKMLHLLYMIYSWSETTEQWNLIRNVW